MGKVSAMHQRQRALRCQYSYVGRFLVQGHEVVEAVVDFSVAGKRRRRGKGGRALYLRCAASKEDGAEDAPLRDGGEFHAFDYERRSGYKGAGG